MKLLLDEQISGKVADRLRKQGYDVVATTADPALRGLSDPDLSPSSCSRREATSSSG